MINQTCALNECESFSIRVAPGEYHSFPLVDNKGLFSNFKRTNNEFKYSHEEFTTERGIVIGVYKKVGCFAILVCAFSKFEELNDEARKIIAGNEKLRNCIKNLQ